MSRAAHPRYRICDNYLRFYLRYIEPHRDRIEKGINQIKTIEGLKGIDTILGLQFENLVLNQLPQVIDQLGIKAPIENAGPYF